MLRKASWTPLLRSFLSRPRTHWRDLISVLSGWKNLDSGKYCRGGAQPTLLPVQLHFGYKKEAGARVCHVHIEQEQEFLMLTGLEEDSAASLKSLPSTNQQRLISDHSQRRNLLADERSQVHISMTLSNKVCRSVQLVCRHVKLSKKGVERCVQH